MGDKLIEKKYILMNKDIPLTSFCLATIGKEQFTISDIKIINASVYDSERTLEEFITFRKAPVNREYIKILFGQMVINSIIDYLDISYALSLNDSLWMKPAEAVDDISWVDINLYDHEFNDIIAHFAFFGKGAIDEKSRSISPEFSTNGMLPKCWCREDNEIYLYKGGTSGCSNTGNEPYSKYMCSALLDAMGIQNYVKYTLKKFNDSLVSFCRLFTSKQVGYVPVYKSC